MSIDTDASFAATPATTPVVTAEDAGIIAPRIGNEAINNAGRPERKRCGAKTRSGGKCTQAPIAGMTRCRLHGGKTPCGKDSPHFKHGFYAKALPTDLRKNFESLMKDPQLLEGKAEVALMQLRLQKLSARISSSESGKAWSTLRTVFAQFRAANQASDQDGMIAALNRMNEIVEGEVNDEDAWDELGEFVDKATRVAEREWKRVLANRQMMTVEQAHLIAASLIQAVNTHVQDYPTRAAIAEHFRRLNFAKSVTESVVDPADATD